MFPLNLPNALTVVRILLVPVLVVALTVETKGGSFIAAGVFALAALTDGLDGYIARSRQAITTFGKVMDPVADKLLIAAALISLVSLDRLEPWVAMVIIAREFAVSGLRIAAGQQGVVIPASKLGSRLGRRLLPELQAQARSRLLPELQAQARRGDARARTRADHRQALLTRAPPAVKRTGAKPSLNRPPAIPAWSRAARGDHRPPSRAVAARSGRAARRRRCACGSSRGSLAVPKGRRPHRGARSAPRPFEPSRGRNPRRSAAACAPSRPPPARPAASSARRSPSSWPTRRSPAARPPRSPGRSPLDSRCTESRCRAGCASPPEHARTPARSRRR